MAKKIINPKITHISLVKKGANGRTFFIAKSDENGNGELTVDAKFFKNIEKSADGRHVLKCVVYAPGEVDSQGDFMDEETIEKFAYDFMKNYRNVDHNHDFEGGFGDVVEGYIAPVDMIVNGEKITKGTFVGGFEVSEEVFEMYKNGEITGVSIGGTGQRVEATVTKSEDNASLVKTIISELKNVFVTKKQYENNNNESQEEKDVEELKKLMEAIQKSISAIEEKQENLEKSIKEAGEKVDGIEKSVDTKIAEAVEKSTKVEKSDKEKMEEERVALTKSVEEANKRLSEIEATLDAPNTVVAKSEPTQKSQSPFYE
jgi:hypothetical protein